MLLARASTSQWMGKFTTTSPVTMPVNIFFSLLACKCLQWPLCSTVKGFKPFSLISTLKISIPRMLTYINLFFFFFRKSFTINSPEISQQCEKEFKTSYLEFGSAFTYVITRKVSDSLHWVRHATQTLLMRVLANRTQEWFNGVI